MSVDRDSLAYEILQDVLRRRRLAAGLRQADLAERLGLPQSFVSKIESGERRVDVVELQRICAALGVSLIDVLTEFEQTLSEAGHGTKQTISE